MLDNALKLLKEFTKRSYKAYIVGGFVRDSLLGIESNDIDITTNAKPKEIKEIFQDCCLPNEDYGSVVVVKWGVHFEITTFRQDIDYIDNRRPSEVKYIDELYPDILRRDFIINTLCMDEDGNIIDFLGGQEDVRHHLIRTVGCAKNKFEEDALRILRAIRFATILDFTLADDVCCAIKETKHLVKNLSYQRKREELDKIFNSPYRDKGIQLLLDFHLGEELELHHLDQVIGMDVNSVLAIWSFLQADHYPFTKNELEMIHNIQEAMNLNNLDPMALYSYGLYVNSCAGRMKGLELRDINESYNALPIKSWRDIDIDSEKIMKILNRKPGKYIKEIYSNIEREILYKRLNNQYDEIKEYIINHYGG